MLKFSIVLIPIVVIVTATLFFGEVAASMATALGVFFAAWQIWEGRAMASISFEDSFNQQYRSLIYLIPVDALLGKELKDDLEDKSREAIYNYLDLCNEQIYQRHKK